jgi:hypothetical protein
MNRKEEIILLEDEERKLQEYIYKKRNWIMEILDGVNIMYHENRLIKVRQQLNELYKIGNKK